MDLRPPPKETSPRPIAPLLLLLSLQLVTLGLIVGLWVVSSKGKEPTSDGDAPERARAIASKLTAAGAMGEAATLYEEYLAGASLDASAQAKITYRLGGLHLELGQYERALRWLYEADALDTGELSGQIGPKIVHALERLGRPHAAKAALASRVQLGDKTERSSADPVVAKIGKDEVRRSEVQRALDDLPPQLAAQFAKPEARGEFLRKFVADELLWRKAQKLEYAKDPEVRRRLELLEKQLVVSSLVEREVLGKVGADPEDLKNYYEANKKRFEKPLEEVRVQVEREYRSMKAQAGYQALIAKELSAEEVKLFAEKMR